jgi:hypothetical protein
MPDSDSRSAAGGGGSCPRYGIKGKQGLNGFIRNRLPGAMGVDEGWYGTDITFFGALTLPCRWIYQDDSLIAEAILNSGLILPLDNYDFSHKRG